MGLMYRLRELKNFRKTGIPSDADGPAWERPYETLRKKWVQVPTTAAGSERTTRLLELSDEALVAEWEKARMDITLTFVDLVESNLKVLQRICGIMGLSDVRFVLFQDLSSLKPLDADYDVVMAMGSLHNAPVKVMKPEYRELLRHLKVGGRWLQLAYPRSRWIREGRPPFSKWGEITDGFGTPWCEPYDLAKLLSMFEPAKFDVVLYQEFHNSDFNWFDLLYRG